MITRGGALMNWLFDTFKSSIGKKLLMALTGLAFCGFLVAHLAGNMSIYGGKEAFNNYAERLHALGILLFAAELGLLVLALIHIPLGLLLFYQNTKARPVRYKVSKSAGGRTIGSATMPYTGFFLLIFIIFHLNNFSFADKTGTTIYDIVAAAFSNPLYVGYYIVAMIVAAVHVSHGLWSAFQTIGTNHPKYMPMIRTLSLVFALVVGIGFGLLPLYFSISA
jgi:succinate dehydrogenase / fumarate reductase, cytochrome b subunit